MFASVFLLNIVYFSVCLTSNKLYWIDDQLVDVSTRFYKSASWSVGELTGYQLGGFIFFLKFPSISVFVLPSHPQNNCKVNSFPFNLSPVAGLSEDYVSGKGIMLNQPEIYPSCSVPQIFWLYQKLLNSC